MSLSSRRRWFSMSSNKSSARAPRRALRARRMNIEPLEQRQLLSLTVWVDDSNGGMENGSQANPYNTIAEGVAAVDAGGTVNVAAGNYTESLDIPRAMTLHAEAGGNVRVQPNPLIPGGQWGNMYGKFGVFAVQGVNNVTIENFAFETGNNTGANAYTAIYTGGASNLTITGNSFANTGGQWDWGAVMSAYGDNISNFVFQDNQVNNVGMYLQWSSAPGNQIVRNTFTGGYLTFDNAPDFEFHNNNLSSSTAILTYNSNSLGTTVDAENNYWGQSTGPLGQIDPVTGWGNGAGTVDFMPYVTAPFHYGPDLVAVDDNWSTKSAGDAVTLGSDSFIIGRNAFDTIPAGISAVTAGGTVNVAAGTYTDGFSVNKALTLSGPNAAINPNTGARVPEAVLTLGAYNNEFSPMVASSGVAIRGFSFENGYGLQASQTLGSPLTGISIDHNRFINVTSTAVFIGVETNGLTVAENRIDGVTGSTNSGINLWNSDNAIVRDNVVMNTVYAGLQVIGDSGKDVTNISVTRNQITNVAQQGIQLADYINGATVSDNVITSANTANQPDKGGIRLYGANFSGAVSITGNVVTASLNGLAIRNGQNITGKNITVSNNSFGGNTKAIYHGGTGTLNASGNWLGIATPAGAAAAIGGTGPVDYTPWLANGTDTAPGTPGFQGDYSNLWVDDDGAQTGSTGRINEALGLLVSPGTLNVATGAYTENVSLASKSVNLVPGSSPGQVTINGDLTLDSNDTLTVELNGTAAGTGYDQLAVSGNADLGGATLSATAGAAFATGNELRIVDSTGGDTDPGLFAGLGDKQRVTIDGQRFRIFYHGGTGNDVVLIRDYNAGSLATVYVDDNWASAIPGTDPDGAGSATEFGLDAFATIQEAINAVDAGGTVYVAAGSYTENLVLTKRVTLLGAQAGVDARGRAVSESIVSPATASLETLGLQSNVGGITVDGFTFSGGTSSFGVIRSTTGTLDNLQLLNNRVVAFTGKAVNLDNSGTDITVDRNVFDGSSNTAAVSGVFHLDTDTFTGFYFTNNWVLNAPFTEGFYVDGNRNVGPSAARSPLISGNKFSNNSVGGNVGKRSLLNATISENEFRDNTNDGLQGGPKDSLITRNVFSGNDRWGLALTSFSDMAVGKGAINNTVSENFFSNNTGQASSGDILMSSAQATGNAGSNLIVGNSLQSPVGLSYAGSETIKAGSNWWGTNSDAAVSAKIVGAGSANVDRTPYFDAGTDTDGTTAGFQGDYSRLHATVSGAQVGATGRIQEAIDLLAGISGVVTVEAGTYAENVTVGKSLTLDGVGNATVVDPASGIALSVTGGAATVVVSDLRITGATTAVAVIGAGTFTMTNVSIDGNASGGTIADRANVNLTPTTNGTADVVDIGTPAVGGLGGKLRLGAAQDILTFVGITNLNVFTLAGDDTVNVAPHATTVIGLDGGDPTSGSPGDTLVYYSDGVNPFIYGPATITTATKAAINYTGFETRAVSGNLVLDGTGANDTLTVNATSATSGTYQLNSDPAINFVGITKLTFNGLAGDDTLIVNNPSGGLFAPSTGVFFNGGADSDQLKLLGGSGTSGFYNVGPTADAGYLEAVNGATQKVTFTGLDTAKPIVETATLGSFTINATGLADTIGVVSGPNLPPQTLEVGFNNAFEKIQLANKTAVTINAGDGNDVIDVDYSTASAGLTALTINGDAGADTINVKQSTPSGVTTNLNGGDNDDAFDFTAGVLLRGSIDGNGQSDTLDLDAYASPRAVVLSGIGATDGYAGAEAALSGTFTNINVLLGPAAAGDTLTGPNRANTWQVTANNTGSIMDGILAVDNGPDDPTIPGSAGTGQALAFTSFENLTGGSANDWFALADGFGVSGQIDGKAGNDTLDLRDYTTAVAVDLSAGTATGVTGGLVASAGDGSSIENVLGGSGSDTITGDQDANILGDGLGSDVLSAGLGSDRYVLTPGGGSVDALNETKAPSGVDMDTIDFSLSSAAVTIDLDLLAVPQNVFGGNTVQLNREAASPAPSGFEDFIGSRFADTLWIDPLAVAIRTVDGNNPTTSVGDLLNFEGGGSVVLDTGISLTASGIGSIVYSEIETVEVYNGAARIVDNADSGWSTVGAWAPWSGEGYQNDVHSIVGSASDIARWTFDGVTPGYYQVAITWPEKSDRTTTAQFRIKDGATVIYSQTINEQNAPAGFSDQGAVWQILGGLQHVTGHTLVVEVTGTAGSKVVADAVRIERVRESAAEIRVLQQSNSQIVANETGAVTFGSTPQGTPISRTFVLQNLGTASLNVGAPTLPSGFSTTFAGATVPGGGSTTFTVTLAATAAGSYSGAVSFTTTDVDDNPFSFVVSGTVTVAAPPAATIVDDGDAGWSSSGAWTYWNPQGYLDDVRSHAAGGTTAEYAQWQIPVAAAGVYRVMATWSVDPNRATNSPFTVSGGAGPVSAAVNQNLAPQQHLNAVNDQGVWWADVVPAYVMSGPGMITVRLTGAGANSYVVADAIRVQQVTAPEIAVFEGTTELADGTSAVDYGSTNAGVPVVKTFTVKNVGANTLTLTEPIGVPLGYTLVQSFSSTTLTTNQTATFQVRLDAAAPGVVSGAISIISNDGDGNEVPFDFQVAGLVGGTIVDDGDPGFATTAGAWSVFPGQGFGNDIHYAIGGSGANTATWTFSGLTPNMYYQVAATWFPNGNRATNSPFTVTGGSAPATARLNQQLAPNDLSDQGASFEQIAVYKVTGTTLTVTLSDLGTNGYVIADAVRIAPSYMPEIEVETDGAAVQDDQSTVAFGSTLVGQPVTKTFTVTNKGQLDLVLGNPPSIVGSGFSIVGGGFSATRLQTGQTATLQVRFDATALGASGATLSFLTNDIDEAPFSFNLTGTATSGLVIDNGDPTGWSTVGTWTAYAGQGYLNDIQYHGPGGGAGKAVWTFSGLQTGERYRVWTTWNPSGNRTTAAPYTITGGGSPASAVVNQQPAPNQLLADGVYWDQLVSSYTITGSTLTVELSDAIASGYAIADAVRVEHLYLPEIEVTESSVSLVSNQGTVDFGTCLQGMPVDRTFTVTNSGVQNLTLGALALPTGYSLVSSYTPGTVLAAAQSLALTIRFTAPATTGTYAGQLTLASNDADENPFRINLTAKSDTRRVIDNGDAIGWSVASGTWGTYAGQGYLGDIHYAINGNGANKATWTFSNLVPGNSYNVYATWFPSGNRATNAQFKINGTAQSLVNQQAAPVGVSDLGVTWQNLAGGAFTLSSGSSIVVELSDFGANGYVIADAVRITQAPNTLLAPVASKTQAPAIRAADLAPIVTEARARWNALGLTAAQRQLLQQVSFIVSNLGGRTLGSTVPRSKVVSMDDNAAGYGWFVDRTPGRDEEFATVAGSLAARRGTAAYGRIDLLTAVMHELGHILGRPDMDADLVKNRVMADELGASARRLPVRADLLARDALFADLATAKSKTGVAAANLLGSLTAQKAR